MDNNLLIVLMVGLVGICAGVVIGWLMAITKYKPIEKALGNLKIEAATTATDRNHFQQLYEVVSKSLQEAETFLRESRQLATSFSERLHAETEKNVAATQELAATRTKLDEARKSIIQHGNDYNRLKAQLEYRDEQLVAQKQQLEEIGTKFSREFQALAQKVMDEKTNSFHQIQEKSLADLLTPLKENLQTFKQDFELKYKVENDDRISLREQINQMMQLNQTLSSQANNLTNALRGQVKHQGNWGEMILESILEYADLKKDIHYFVQEKTVGEDGQMLLPDVIVRYPDGRSIVIDSKVSLLHYEQYCSATEDGPQRLALNLMQQSVTRHIDSLSSKKYAEAVNALDFVMLFVPVEGAYITLMQANPQIWQYAYRKRVLLISPTNLIAAMKLVYDLWKREAINQNAQEVAEKAVRIYEKLAAFLEDFEKAGFQLEKAAGCFADAKKKLHTGKGNVISTALQMKQKLHHNKPQRELPTTMTTDAELEN